MGIPSSVERLVFLFIGAGFYALLAHTCLNKKEGDRYESLLNIEI